MSDKTFIAGEHYITLAEAARQSGFTVNYLYTLVRYGRLRGKRTTNRWLVDEQAMQAYVANRSTRPRRGRPKQTPNG